jgi:hypothetical protein
MPVSLGSGADKWYGYVHELVQFDVGTSSSRVSPKVLSLIAGRSDSPLEGAGKEK